MPKPVAATAITQGDFSLWYSEHKTEFNSNQLTIHGAGVGVVVSYSIEGMPLRAIGTYHLPALADDADVAGIRREVERLLSSGAKGVSTAPTFGMKSKLLRMSLAQKPLNYLVNADEPFPSELDAIEAGLERLTQRAAQAPMLTLSMKLGLSPGSLSVGDEIEISISFQNTGRFALDFVNPAAFRANGPNAFRLNFWRPTGDADEPYEYEWTLDLVERELLVADDKTLSSKAESMALSPGAQIVAWTKLPLPRCDPGQYLVELVYTAAPPISQPEGDRRIFGELHADGVPVSVIRRR